MGQVRYPVPFETSITDPDTYAGARVARMILGFLGAAAIPAVETLYAHAAAYNDPGEGGFWAIDPGALERTIVDYDPRGGDHWVVYQNTVPMSADNQIQYTLDIYKVPAACLLYSGGHWVCVNGYTFDDATMARTAFIMNDPAYVGGGADVQVAPAGWDAVYRPVNGGTKWNGKIVEVGDPDPTKTEVPWAPRKIVRPGDRIIPPEEAARLAIEGALSFAAENRRLRKAVEAGQVGTPQLVARLDRRGSYYYLVPVTVSVDQQEQPLATIMIDGRFGDVLSVSAADEPYPLWQVDPDEVIDIVTRKPIPLYESATSATARLMDALNPAGREVPYGELRRLMRSALTSYAAPRERLILRPDDIEISETWVWHPGQGSSPFHPYYEVRNAWKNVYVNTYTGDLHTSLYTKGVWLGY